MAVLTLGVLPCFRKQKKERFVQSNQRMEAPWENYQSYQSVRLSTTVHEQVDKDMVDFVVSYIFLEVPLYAPCHVHLVDRDVLSRSFLL